MKKFFLLIIGIILISCNLKNEENKKKHINIDNLDSVDLQLNEDAKSAYKIDSIRVNEDIFYLSNSNLYVKDNYIGKYSVKKDQSFFSINALEYDKENVINKDDIKEKLNNLLGVDVIDVFYSQGLSFVNSSITLLVKDKEELYTWYLLFFNSKGKYKGKFLLSEEKDLPGFNSRLFSRIIKEEKQIKTFRINSMIDEYINENKFSEKIDTIVEKYIFNKDSYFTLKSSDTISNKVFTGYKN